MPRIHPRPQRPQHAFDRNRPSAMLTAETGLIPFPMTFIVKTKSDTLPAAVRQQAGIKIGDMLEFKVSGRVVTIMPKLPTADDEYTPEQRAIVDARLADGLACPR